MKKDYIAELALYIWIRTLNKFFSFLPLGLSLAIGRSIARLGYLFPTDRKKTAYKNIRLSLCDTYSPEQLKIILKKTYDNWGMNFIEAVMLSRMDAGYLAKYVEADGLSQVKTLLDQNKGVVMMGSHFGSWEILHIGIPQKGGFDFHILARPQKLKMAADYLDSLRKKNNCFVIYKGMSSREAISVLKDRKALGLVIDQGGRTEDAFIKFFGRLTPTPTGLVRFASKFDAPIFAGYITRTRGSYHRIKILPPYFLEKKDSPEETLIYNQEKLNRILEGYVREHPSEYFWFHKRWKYSRDKNILVLTDGKAGHLRQIEAFLGEFRNIFNQNAHGFNLDIKIVTIKFKNNFRKLLLNLYVLLFGKFFDSMSILEFALDKNSYQGIAGYFSDIVLSCGSSTNAAALAASKENVAKSVVLMRPSLFLNRFNIVIAPSHDRLPKRKNVFITKGAINSIDRQSLDKQKDLLALKLNYKNPKQLKIGVLIGGNTKNFSFNPDTAIAFINQLKQLEAELDIDLFISTSRRTPAGVEAALKNNFKKDTNCKLLLIVNEENFSGAVNGILGLCDIIITSSDSISMISEAASSGKYVVVFKLDKPNAFKKTKHDIFLDELASQGFINLINISDIETTVKNIFHTRPKINVLDNKSILREAIGRLF